MLQRAGRITDLERQVAYELAPGVRFDGAKRAQPALRLIVDFRYRQAGELVLEDVKSPATMTPVFRIKRHLLLVNFGLQVRVTQ